MLRITKKLLFMFLVLTFFAMSGGYALATPAVSFDSVTNTIANITTLAGWSFTVNNQNITVDALGAYDNPLDTYAFTGSTVGIYDVATANLIVSADVSSTDPYSSFFHWTSLAAPATLYANRNYIIVAFTGPNQRTWQPGGFAVHPDITFGQNWWTNNAVGLQYPTSQDSSIQSYFGPNFNIARSTVPEPTSLLLLGTGLGAIGLAAWRRRKQ